MYAKINENGDIESYADFQYPGSIKVDYNIVRGYDGRLYREGEEPVKTNEEAEAEAAAAARAKRDSLIAETDYLFLSDYPLDEAKKAAWTAYRQALRDIPEQDGWPMSIIWPEKPEN